MQRRFVERARHLEALEYRLELPLRCDFSRRRNDEAENVAPPQRHANHVADLQRQITRVIAQRPIETCGFQNREDLDDARYVRLSMVPLASSNASVSLGGTFLRLRDMLRLRGR
jgi:hypothetical protein